MYGIHLNEDELSQSSSNSLEMLTEEVNTENEDINDS